MFMAATSKRDEGAGMTIEPGQLDGMAVLRVTGELDLSTAPGLCARIEEVFERGALCVVVDLSRLEFCDSTGLRALLGAAQEARVRLARLFIVPPSSSVAARAFELAGASEFLPLIEHAATNGALASSLTIHARD